MTTTNPAIAFAAELVAPWHLDPDRAAAVLQELAQMAAAWSSGDRSRARWLIGEAEAEAAEGGESGPEPGQALPRSIRRQTGGIAVIRAVGPLLQRSDMWSRFFGIPSYEGITQQLQQAVADQTIKAVMLLTDSPGGIAFGVPELAAKILAARDVKPIVAMIDGRGASAAYWLASQTSEVVLSPSGTAGSIGTVVIHSEISRMLDEQGETVNVIRSPERKVEANPFEPLTDVARDTLQAQVDQRTRDFEASVAAGRGVEARVVSETFGQGSMMLAPEARAAGLVDRVDTVEGTLERLGASPSAIDDANDALMSDEVRRRQHELDVVTEDA